MPVADTIWLYGELSINVDDWQVNKTVFAIAVNADVGGVKLEV